MLELVPVQAMMRELTVRSKGMNGSRNMSHHIAQAVCEAAGVNAVITETSVILPLDGPLKLAQHSGAIPLPLEALSSMVPKATVRTQGRTGQTTRQHDYGSATSRIIELLGDGRARGTKEISKALDISRTSAYGVLKHLRDGKRVKSRDVKGNPKLIEWQLTGKGKKQIAKALVVSKKASAMVPTSDKLSGSEAETITAARKLGGEWDAAALAAKLKIKKNACEKRIQGLIKKGWVLRVKPGDLERIDDVNTTVAVRVRRG